MRLFEIDPDTSTVALNKPWIMLVPQFKALLDRDKGSEGDYRGSKKLKARKEFTYIYFMVDFTSPITDWADEERHKEALYYAGLDKIDEAVETALKKYDELQLKAARSLRTYRALLRSLDAMDEYYENLDMKKLDKKGSLLNDPATVTASIKKLDEMHTAVNNFRKRAEQELKDASTGIRGTAVLGDNEERVKEFSEADVIKGSEHLQQSVNREGGGSFDKMLATLTQITKVEVTDQEVDQVKEEEDE